MQAALDSGDDVNEVEGAGNTPLHAAAYEGFLQGCELLLSKVSTWLDALSSLHVLHRRMVRFFIWKEFANEEAARLIAMRYVAAVMQCREPR
jgi:ankyrin repeat protein